MPPEKAKPSKTQKKTVKNGIQSVTKILSRLYEHDGQRYLLTTKKADTATRYKGEKKPFEKKRQSLFSALATKTNPVKVPSVVRIDAFHFNLNNKKAREILVATSWFSHHLSKLHKYFSYDNVGT